MEITVKDKRKHVVTVDDVMRQSRREGETVPVNTTDRVDITTVRCTSDQFHGIEAVAGC